MYRHARAMEYSYKTAIDLLNGIRRQARPSTKQAFKDLQQVPSTNGEPQMKGTPSIVGMREWLQRIGHTPADISSLNIVHVAGTKGKGSTCAFVDSLLRAVGERTGFPAKVGLYTSPHLVCPEERIRINFAPLPQEKFAKYVWEVYNKLAKTEQITNEGTPRYLQLLALVSFHAFIQEGVQAAVYETHHGGEFDATNVIEDPVATVVTSLGMDHVAQLGPTIENIAWHKAGIFKSGAPAFTPPQDPLAMRTLKRRAHEKSAKLQVIDYDASLPRDIIQLKPDVQRTNCSIALAAVRSFLYDVAHGEHTITSDDIDRGLQRFFWPGRFQMLSQTEDFNDYKTDDVAKLTTVPDLGPHQWFLDSAHNEMSVTQAGEWFIETAVQRGSQKGKPRIIVFTQLSDQREGKEVLRTLAGKLRDHHITHVIFTTYEIGGGVQTIVKEPQQDSSVLNVFETIWRDYVPSSEVMFQPTITNAIEAAKAIGAQHGGMQVLVTGSQHLVGGALLLLKPQQFGMNTPGQLSSRN